MSNIGFFGGLLYVYQQNGGRAQQYLRRQYRAAAQGTADLAAGTGGPAAADRARSG